MIAKAPVKLNSRAIYRSCQARAERKAFALRGTTAPFARVALCLCFFGCAGTEKQSSGGVLKPEPAADPSAQITMHSAAAPNRTGAGEDLGRSVANKLMTQVSDCDLTVCIGDPSPQLIDSVRARAAEARACYEEALKSTPTLAGRLILSLRITHDGHCCPITTVQNELATSKALVPCILALMEESYPRPISGCVDLNLPLKFVPEYIEADAGAAGAGAPANSSPR